MVRWTLPIHERNRAEVFSEWADTHPEEIAALRGSNERKQARAFERLHKHCLKVAEKARKDLASKDWGTFAEFEPLIAEELEDCARDTDDERFAAAQLERVLREEATGAPF